MSASATRIQARDATFDVHRDQAITQRADRHVQASLALGDALVQLAQRAQQAVHLAHDVAELVLARPRQILRKQPTRRRQVLDARGKSLQPRLNVVRVAQQEPRHQPDRNQRQGEQSAERPPPITIQLDDDGVLLASRFVQQALSLALQLVDGVLVRPEFAVQLLGRPMLARAARQHPVQRLW